MTAELRPIPVHPLLYDDLLRAALREDLGRAGDLTTAATVPRDLQGVAEISVRSDGVAAGLDVVARLFSVLDPSLVTELLAADGDDVCAGEVLATVRGSAASILTGERVALNLLGRLSGIATATAGVVRVVAGTGASVVCTRKTTPGMRVLEKHAVRCGGGNNHRFGLDDAVLVKDNHIAFAGGLRPALEGVRRRIGHLTMVEVEVDTLEQLDELLALHSEGAPVHAVLLDNFAPTDLAIAVDRVGGRLVTEASGGITPESARRVAESGVDLLSLGWLTHSVPALDVGLDVRPR